MFHLRVLSSAHKLNGTFIYLTSVKELSGINRQQQESREVSGAQICERESPIML